MYVLNIPLQTGSSKASKKSVVRAGFTDFTETLKELCHGIFIHFADVKKIIFSLKETSQ